VRERPQVEGKGRKSGKSRKRGKSGKSGKNIGEVPEEREERKISGKFRKSGISDFRENPYQPVSMLFM
jgi:hypothetical protein